MNKVLNDFKAAQRNLRTSMIQTHRQASREAVRFCKAIAPIDTGRLREGIGYVITVQGRNVHSSIIKSRAMGALGFPYNFWVNQRPIRYITARNPAGRHFFAKQTIGKRIIYGGNAMGPRHPLQWSGTPAYFDKMIIYMERYFPDLAKKLWKRGLAMSFKGG